MAAQSHADRAAFKVIIHKALCNDFAGRVGQAAAKPRWPTISSASIGGPALAFARWSHPTFHRSINLSTHSYKAARSHCKGADLLLEISPLASIESGPHRAVVRPVRVTIQPLVKTVP